MRLAQLLAIISGSITVALILLPFLFLGGSGNSESYGALGVLIISWGILSPLTGMLAIVFVCIASVLRMRSPETSRRRRISITGVWGGSALLAVIVLILTFVSSSGGTPITFGVVGVAILTFVSFAVVVGVSSVAAQSSRTRRLPAALLGTVTACLVVAVALGMFIVQSGPVRQYQTLTQAAEDWEARAYEQTRENEADLATACLSVDEAHAALERIGRIADAPPPVFPQEQLITLKRETADAKRDLTAFDPAVCEETTTVIVGEIKSAGLSLDEIDWASGFASTEVARLRGIGAAPTTTPLSFWKVTREAVADAEARRDLASDEFQRMRDNENLAASHAIGVVSQPFYLISGEMRGTITESSEQVIATADAEGTPAATKLRALAAADNSTVDEATMLTNLEAYAMEASAMLAGANK